MIHKWQGLNGYIIILPILFIRISITLFLLRIFGRNRPWRYGLYFVLSMHLLFAIISFSLLLAFCEPVKISVDRDLPRVCWNPHTKMVIATFNGGKYVPLYLRTGTEIRYQSYVGFPRLDPCFFTFRFHVGHKFEYSCQNWDLYPDGNGLLVSIAMTKATSEDMNGVLRSTCSTGIITLARTVVVKTLTSSDPTCKPYIVDSVSRDATKNLTGDGVTFYIWRE